MALWMCAANACGHSTAYKHMQGQVQQYIKVRYKEQTTTETTSFPSVCDVAKSS
jgi:hypothetical protein